MMTITKRFVQRHVAHDCEAREWVWEGTELDYETLVTNLGSVWNAWFNGVRVVDKVFDDETFTIETKVVKMAMRHYNDRYQWDGVETF